MNAPYNQQPYQQSQQYGGGADLFGGLTTEGVQPMAEQEIYPEGTYVGMIVDIQQRTSRTNSNSVYTELKYVLLDPPQFNGKFFYHRISPTSANQTAVDMAKRFLASLRIALGLSHSELNPAAFMQKPMKLKIGVRQSKDANKNPIPGKFENSLNNVLNVNAQDDTQQQPQQAQPPQAPAVQPYQAGPAQQQGNVQQAYNGPPPGANTSYAPPPSSQPPQGYAAAPGGAPAAGSPPSGPWNRHR